MCGGEEKWWEGRAGQDRETGGEARGKRREGEMMAEKWWGGRKDEKKGEMGKRRMKEAPWNRMVDW